MNVSTFSPEFGYVVLSAAVVGIHYKSTARYVVARRKKYGVDYPDTGSGRYSQKLELKQWVDFNNAQRVHLNYLEDLPLVFSMLFFSGTFHPLLTTAMAAAYVVGRQVYATGYVTKGPEGRMLGSLIHHMALLGMIGSAAYGAIGLLQWFK